MARSDLVPLVLAILAIEISMKVFLGVNTPSTTLLTMFTGSGGIQQSGLLAWLNNNLLMVAGFVGGAIAIGATLFGGSNRLDFVIFAGLAFTFVSYVTVFQELYNQLYEITNSFFSLQVGPLFAILIVAPIVVLYIFAILQFWRGVQ